MKLEEQLKQTPAFRGEAGFLSNFSPYLDEEWMQYGNLIYVSNEHFYQAMKFLDYGSMRKISEAPFKGLKRFVRTLGPIREDWDTVKMGFMAQGLKWKFSCPRYRKLLLNTGDLELVERNTWNDTYWGVCNGVGENRLGKMLMQLREVIKKEIS